MLEVSDEFQDELPEELKKVTRGVFQDNCRSMFEDIYFEFLTNYSTDSLLEFI